MSYYISKGKIPAQRHTVFEKDGDGIYYEQLISSQGFSDIYSLSYHCNPPTAVREIGNSFSVAPEIVEGVNMQLRSFQGFNIKPEKDYIKSRKIVLFNDDVQISLAAPSESMNDYFFKNGDADEMLFIHKGEGTLRTMYGNIAFSYGDHLMIPRGVTYAIDFKTADNRLFILESHLPLRFPKRYQNREGQLLEDAPFYERDIKVPQEMETHDEKGTFKIMVKRENTIFPYTYDYHPFDVVGWDGHFYPYAFSIHDFQPITGKLHMPPPIHQTFETPVMVVCAFVPRLYDYHPKSIPAPYNHHNIDTDEVLYYVDGDFMSRNNIQKGQITLHPIGVTHGPHPGAIERSIGKKETEELALMVDTFKPLKMTKVALGIEDKDYWASWQK